LKTAIYGAGQFGKIFDRIINADFFIDKFKSGSLNNKPILKIKEIPQDVIIYNSVIFDESDVLRDLEKFNIISFENTLKKFPKIIEEFKKEKFLWLKGKLINEKLKEVRTLFKDEISLDFFDKWVNFRKTFDMKYYPSPTNSLKEQYFIDEFKHSKKFVDCGAYIGDTALEYFKLNSGKVISFEADPNNVKKLKENVKNKNVLIYPIGVYSKTTILKLTSLGSGSFISNKGDNFISVTSLDETIYNFKPDYIKIDIEDSEKEALIGAKEIIKDFKPKLAISIYHKAEDLWEIPLLIKELNPNYEFKIRCHNYLCIETILYCKDKNDR